MSQRPPPFRIVNSPGNKTQYAAASKELKPGLNQDQELGGPEKGECFTTSYSHHIKLSYLLNRPSPPQPDKRKKLPHQTPDKTQVFTLLE